MKLASWKGWMIVALVLVVGIGAYYWMNRDKRKGLNGTTSSNTTTEGTNRQYLRAIV